MPSLSHNMTKLSDSRVWQYSLKLQRNCFSVTTSSLTLQTWLQHARLLCPPLSPRICSNSCPVSQRCYLTISASSSPFFYLQSFPASGLFDESLFAPGGQSIGASASASVLPMSIQGWFPLGLTGLISLLSKGLLWVFSSTIIWKHQFSQPCLWSNSHLYMTTGKIFDCTDLCQPSDISAF